MKKLIILFLLFSSQTWAQSEKHAPAWEVEVDPIAFLLNGYSGHIIYISGKMRYDAGIFAIEQPEGFHGNKGFRLKTRGYGVKASYLVTGTRGLYTGIGTGYISNEATHKEMGETDTGHTLGIGTHLGYRFFLMKDAKGNATGLYITPWMSIDYNVHTDRIRFESQNFKQSNWSFFPTVHLGYRF